MIHNFYPGPSSLHPYFEEAIQAAVSSGILSMNHRSAAFSSLYEQCFETIQHKWDIPENYKLLFVSSATETWEIIAQSLIAEEESLHIYNGAFGKKSFDVANKLTTRAKAFEFPLNTALNVDALDEFPFFNICQNETSNGTAVSDEILKTIKKRFPNSIISVDATSSLGGSFLDFSSADIWYSSVQKCLGLPSGMGIILINEQAINKVKNKNINLHYNDLLNLITNAELWQTTHTPNILSIHALAYTQAKTSSIHTINIKTKKRQQTIIKKLKKHSLLTDTSGIDSSTILTIKENNPQNLITKALESDIILGKGYGNWESDTFRIANFPSIPDTSFELLIDFLTKRA
jgi:phosphoserine aminotransferase